jgi:uncharacterized SAM-binding protein YcdF (DUF218 family)
MKKIAKVLLLIFTALLLLVGLVAARVYSYRNASSDEPADAAVVLGAAVWGAEVSPVFRERINHGIDLYRKGKVRKLIFTGGRGNSDEPTESSAARRYAMRGGVPAADILIEEESHNTYENILYAKRLADARGVRKVLIVSDPMHMKRALVMASDLGLAAEPSPTPSTRYRGWRSQAGQLAYETYYYIGYLLTRPFLKTA